MAKYRRREFLWAAGATALAAGPGGVAFGRPYAPPLAVR